LTVKGVAITGRRSHNDGGLTLGRQIMKRAGYLLALVVLSLAFVFPLPTMAQGTATVSIDAPAEVVVGSTFSARVNITNVTNLNAWNYDVVFNKDVLEVAAVLGGEVGGMPIQPGENQWVVNDGTLRVVNDIPGISTVSGSGYLAVIQFRVIGEVGNTSYIDLQGGMLSNDLASSIPATWGVPRASVAVVAPTISINPVEGCQGKELEVEISGKGLTGATAVSFGDGIDVDFTVNSDIKITATIAIAADAAVGVRDVSVTTTAGTEKLFDGFTVKMSPTIASVSPDKGKRSRPLRVVITGTNFAAATNVSFGEGITVNEFVVNSDTQITARITIASDAKGGARAVSVTNAVGCAGVKAGGFTVLGGVSIWAIALIVIAIGIAVYFGIRWRRRRRAMGMS